MNRKGQFSIIAALLVAVILIATVVMTYSAIRTSPIQDQPQVLSAVDETNLALRQILGFTVGYYGSVMQVTGNSTYAKRLAKNYLQSGLMNIAKVHPEWAMSFTLSTTDMHTYWFNNISYSTGTMAVNYSLPGIGMYGIAYETSCRLTVQIENSTLSNQTQARITRDEGEPIMNLGKQNFKFYCYNYTVSAWDLIGPSAELVVYANGSYLINTPPGVDPYSYVIMVKDTRGIIVVASSFSRYTCTPTWNSTFYSTLQNATIVAELLQNGTMRWLGQNLQNMTQLKPIPPMPVKAIRVNQTINGIGQEVPFQIEDWSSNYRTPLGLTNNESLFSSRTMLVFLMTSNVSKTTIWWNGSDTITQTPFAYTNLYFTNDNTTQGILTNGKLSLTLGGSQWITSVVGNSTAKADFLRVNNEYPIYGAGAAYVIHHGIVRDILQQEAEWGGGISEIVYVDSFNNTSTQWTEVGSSPYLNNNDNNYMYTSNNNNVEGWFGFQNLSVNYFAGLEVDFECYCSGDDYFDFQINDGITTYGWYEVRSLPSSYGWRSYDISSIIDSTSQLNNAKTRIRYRQNGASASTIYIRRCRIEVVTCPNVYSQIVVTLPANATYYTYALRTTFINSDKNRTLADLCPIKLTISTGNSTTENGTQSGFPIVSTASGLFYNYSASTWAHHWSQFASVNGTKGAGIIFTDLANQMLYVFDPTAGNKTGALRVNSTQRTIELLPVIRYPVNFTYALDVTWFGAVATFDATTPIYKEQGGNKTGLWIIVEYPPKITVATEN